MPRLIAISTVNRIVNLAFNVNEEPSRSDIDKTLIDEWTAKYGAVELISDPDVRAEPGDTWDGTQGVAPPTTIVFPPAMPVSLQGISGPIAINTDLMLQVASEPRLGKEVVYSTHNFCDPTTWFGASVRVIGEEAVDNGDGLGWNLANKNIIDLSHGKIFDEDAYILDQKTTNATDPHGFEVTVNVDSSPMTAHDPFTGTGGDYIIDYHSGRITFNQTQGGKKVIVDYSYAKDSTFSIVPDIGFVIDIEKSKAEWSSDLIMTDTLIFQAWGYAEMFAPQLGLPAGTKIPIMTTLYKTMNQFVGEASEYWPNAILALTAGPRNISVTRHAIGFRYATIQRLDSKYGLELRAKLQNDIPFKGDQAIATFYSVVRSL